MTIIEAISEKIKFLSHERQVMVFEYIQAIAEKDLIKQKSLIDKAAEISRVSENAAKNKPEKSSN